MKLDLPLLFAPVKTVILPNGRSDFLKLLKVFYVKLRNHFLSNYLLKLEGKDNILKIDSCPEIGCLIVGSVLSRPEKSLHILLENPVSNLHF